MAGVSGIGGNASGRVDRIIPIIIAFTKSKEVNLSTDALIMDSLTNYIPQFRNPLLCWEHLRGLPLADERTIDATFIQLVIGADLYTLFAMGCVEDRESRWLRTPVILH